MENMGKEVYSYNSECLTCNDRPILPIMGEFHFSRYPEGEWKTALKKMQQGGVDIVAAYVFWIHHEEAEGEWDFSGRRNLKAFLELLSGSRDESMAAHRSVGARRVQERWLPGLAGGERKDGENWLLRTNDPEYLRVCGHLFYQDCRAGGRVYA